MESVMFIGGHNYHIIFIASLLSHVVIRSCYFRNTLENWKPVLSNSEGGNILYKIHIY